MRTISSAKITAHPPHAQGVMMDKNQAMSSYKRFIDNDINEECYGEESCVLGEVIEKFVNNVVSKYYPYRAVCYSLDWTEATSNCKKS